MPSITRSLPPGFRRLIQRLYASAGAGSSGAHRETIRSSDDGSIPGSVTSPSLKSASSPRLFAFAPRARASRATGPARHPAAESRQHDAEDPRTAARIKRPHPGLRPELRPEQVLKHNPRPSVKLIAVVKRIAFRACVPVVAHVVRECHGASPFFVLLSCVSPSRSSLPVHRGWHQAYEEFGFRMILPNSATPLLAGGTTTIGLATPLDRKRCLKNVPPDLF